MIKTLVASTGEVDDVKTAVAEIKSQLNLGSLQKNSIGIIACHYEFVYSGIVKGICEALPFDVVGTISVAQSDAAMTGSLLLTLMVLTSDDVEFVKAETPSLLAEPGRVIAETYKAAASQKTGKPALILSFAAFMLQNSGDEYINVISESSGGVPCFGTLSVDDTLDFSNCFMLSGGEHYRDRMAMILIYGDVHPKFFIANISENKMLDKGAFVTKSVGHVIMEVNERPVMEYFENMGLAKASETQYALTSLPFLLDYHDGAPKVSKIFIKLTPEKYALCAGAIPQGSTLYIAVSDKEDVMFTTGQASDLLLKNIQGSSGLLIYSCVSRYLTLGAEQFKEMELIKQKVGGKIPFMMGCSGGEICPTQVSGDTAINRFHNNAFIACLF